MMVNCVLRWFLISNHHPFFVTCLLEQATRTTEPSCRSCLRHSTIYLLPSLAWQGLVENGVKLYHPHVHKKAHMTYQSFSECGKCVDVWLLFAQLLEHWLHTIFVCFSLFVCLFDCLFVCFVFFLFLFFVVVDDSFTVSVRQVFYSWRFFEHICAHIWLKPM
jgi:hypothetical protein